MAEAAPSSWSTVLDDLEDRVAGAEQGDLRRLDGWAAEPAAGPMTAEDVERAARVLARQLSLLSRLRDEQGRIAQRMSATRKPAFRPVMAPPVYVDRSL